VFAAAVEFDVAAAAACEDCTELTAGVSMGETGAGIVFLLALGEKWSPWLLDMEMGEIVDSNLTDDAASMAESGDASLFASGFVIFNGPRERSAMTGVRIRRMSRSPRPSWAPGQMTSVRGSAGGHYLLAI
jgi:hypothetical protein